MPEPDPADADRLAALQRYDILDTPAEAGFDEIVLLATQVCATPSALVSLVTADRQWFKARIGFEPCETPIEQSVCRHALGQRGLLVIPDLTVDERTRDSPLVTDGRRIRFYAGAPLLTPEGVALGTLCVMDDTPRAGGLSPAQASGLEALARQVMAQMELRRAVATRDAALQAVREGDARHRQVLESAIDYAIITTDLAGLVTGWNAGAQAILGWSETEMRGRTGDAFFTLEDRAAGVPEQEMRAARATGRGNDERWHRRKDGTRFWAAGEMMPLNAENGAHVGYLKILRDRTRRRREEERATRTELALAAAEERQRLAAEATGIGIFDFDPVTGALDWDARVRELFGVAGDAPVTYEGTFLPRLHPDDRDGADAAVQEALVPDGAGLLDIEYRVEGDGERGERWLAARGRTFFRDREAVRFIGTVRDVTTRKASEDALVESEERLRSLNETLERRVEERTRERDRAWKNSRDLQAVVDTDGVVRAANEAWSSILGWDPKEVVGQSYLDLVYPDDHGSSTDALATASAGELPPYEIRNLHKDGGHRWISWVAAPDAGLIYASGRHVTAEKEAAAALDVAQEQLRQSQKMEAVGQLTGGIAHDFNNLLTGIVGSLDLMQTRMSQGRMENIERYAKAASSSAHRAAALTHRLLAFARRQPLDPTPTDAHRLVLSLEDLLRRTIGESISLAIVTAGELWPTLCDAHQLENAILNLAINARDAMPDGGELRLETSNTTLDRAYAARHPDVASGHYVCIAVTDTGTGMPPEVIARAFDPFFTTKPIGQGTGLGLSMIYGFARQSEGHAKIDSEVGRGTTVRLYLPRHAGTANDHPPAAEPVETGRAGEGETVLVVEDEAVVRDLVVEVLSDLGYRAIEARDGPAGLRVLQSRERIDLLVTDIGLPGLNGRQLADRARESRPDLKVLFITGYAENAALASGFLGRDMEMITKPFAVEALAGRIREMVGR